MTQAVRCQFFAILEFESVLSKLDLYLSWTKWHWDSIMFEYCAFTSQCYFTSAFLPPINTNWVSWIKFLKTILRIINCWVLIYRLHVWSFMYREYKICSTLIICPSRKSCRVLVEYFVVCWKYVQLLFYFVFFFFNQYLRKCPKTVFAEWFLISHVLDDAKFFQWYMRFYNTLLHFTWVHFLPPSYPTCQSVHLEPQFLYSHPLQHIVYICYS